MTPLYITSDWHIGAVRQAGTRPDTAYQLRQDLLQKFEEVLYDIVTDGDLLLNGDMADGPNIAMADLAKLFSILSDWLTRTGKKLWLPPGNHDLSKNSTVFSSFQFLAKLLCDQFPGQAHYWEGGLDLGNGCYVISHVPNQDLLELELTRVPECRYLLVHTNFANVFAQASDHSLTISEDQARKLPVQHVVFSHEHQSREAMNGKVIVIGNAQPSSISDCLGNETKRMMKITDSGHEFIETWKAEGDFEMLDWRDLKDSKARFVRITGTATAAEAAQVAQAIARFRQKVDCLVVTNAVRIEGIDDQEALNLSVEQITAFNVQEALLKILTPEEGAKVLKLLNPPQEDSHA